MSTTVQAGAPSVRSGGRGDFRRTVQEVQQVLREVEASYPAGLREFVGLNRQRFAFEAATMIQSVEPGGAVLDLGSGFSPYPILCSRFGLRVTIVDDYGDPFHRENGLGVLDLFRSNGVSIMSGDLFTLDYGAPGELAGVSSFDSMEHWHQSPRSLFQRLFAQLGEGGVFWLGVPNCVNARKRITVPFGMGKWSRMQEWYEQDVFRGHVREPDSGDLRYIARDLGFAEARIIGRNWMGYRNRSTLVRKITPFVDHLLRLNASLCSDIYLLARKRGAAA